ncbi:CocE/NonD family hydrolase [Streptomyces sp. TRM66268-LWL]|uniref:CocE/NonD family hydrolase n=1 Tax=Streptomyces polyasparticus TaxID=2767826 RepID=A0ABR7SGU5_9ACTN|nr:CocE/NonD family hydrolase [Streptomyces polyasparticus]MBC9714721.1 CocE/NonD family hydrolase [Streptomyces polyasparticus]
MSPYTVTVGGLATDVQLPDGEGPFPAVLIRTPYDRRAHRAELRGWARRGFAALAQDVRGRYASPGQWRPYEGEAADGAGIARWIRRRPWSDGRFVACGSSYAAHCAVALALEGPEDARPDAVIAAVPALGSADTAREPSGVERLLTRAGWWAAHGDRPDSDEAALEKALSVRPGLLAGVPLLDFPERLGRDLPSWPGLWRRTERGRLLDRAVRARMPLLAVGGHHDHFAEDTAELWRRWGGPSARLLMGPWGHGLTAAPGPDAHVQHRLKLGELYAEWAHSALAGRLRPGRAGALALGGSPLWLAVDAQGASYAPSLRLLHGAEFIADPECPVSSAELSIPADGEPDRCVLVTPPLPRPLDVFGPAEVRLRGAADTPSADWAARLVTLTPDGHAERIGFGVVRRTEPPGREAEFAVPLGGLARRLRAGTRLRLEICGHHFPAHARNPHTGEDPITATRLEASRRALDPRHTVLRLTVLPARPAPTTPAQEILG